jgi:adenine-specific DNA-methyltransferase
MSEGAIKTKLLNRLIVRNGKNENSFQLEGEWRYSQRKLDEVIAARESLIISKVPFRPNHIKAGGEEKKIKNLLSIAHYPVGTYEDSNAESAALFGDSAFDYPKPEGLLSTLIAAVTEPGDLVLDSFAGSGTTGAVAHKMGRRWIMVELGDHCHTHIIPRLRKVIDGAEPGGVTKAVEWAGGGGFRYYRLAPSLLTQDKWGQWVISKDYNAPMLAEAVCKHMGFTYAPSESVYWQQGHSTERDFIYVTTATLSHDQLQELSDEVGPERTLLVVGSAFRGRKEGYPNLTTKKIPSAVLTRCEWGHDDYSLKIENLPKAPPQIPKTDAKTGQQSLFGEEGGL